MLSKILKCIEAFTFHLNNPQYYLLHFMNCHCLTLNSNELQKIIVLLWLLKSDINWSSFRNYVNNTKFKLLGVQNVLRISKYFKSLWFQATDY